MAQRIHLTPTPSIPDQIPRNSRNARATPLPHNKNEGSVRVTYLCRRCMRPSVSREAWVEWDIRAQRWVIARLFDAAYCHVCETDTTLIERDVSSNGTPTPTTQ